MMAISKTYTRSHPALERVFNLKLIIFCSGAYGEVRKCQHKETKALRAVKIINKKLLEEEEKDKLLNEVHILRNMVNLTHLSLINHLLGPSQYP
jgi:serine/threonine protein kinase